MKILVTGGGGFLARGLVIPLAEAGHKLRLMDIMDFESPHEVAVGSVADPDCVMKQAEGMDGIVIAHMLGRGPGAYETPGDVIDVNVKGTLNLLHAAVQHGIKKVVLISSEAAVSVALKGPGPYTRDMPIKSEHGLYGLSKAMQEIAAEQYSREHGLQIAALRVGYILDGDACKDKYGRDIRERAPQDTDRRDIGEVARLCLERDVPGYEVFHVMSTPESMISHDVQYTCDRLGWKPKYDFTWLPCPQKTEG